MESDGSGVPTAADLITYIGIPLTLVGLLPIAYNFVVTLIHLHNIKTVLRRNRVPAKLHSDIFNRIVQVEFPKYVIQSPQPQLSYEVTRGQSFGLNHGIPLGRLDSGSSSPREEQPPLAEQSDIAGGSWSFLEWDRRQIRSHTQRTQPGDVLRQPQAQIRFWDLIVRLHLLGAVVHEEGWSELQRRPLWARGCRLMTLADPRQKSSLILQVASYNDSDSPVSLQFARTGLRRDWSYSQKDAPGLPTLGLITLSANTHRHDGHNGQDYERVPNSGSVVCHVTDVGLVSVSASSTIGATFNIEHLRINDDHSRQGIWFASCATALYVQSPTPILEYRIPTSIHRLSRARVIPAGVIDILYGNGIEEIPAMITIRYLSELTHTDEERDAWGWQQKTSPRDDRTQREIEIRKKRRVELRTCIDRIERSLSTPLLKGFEIQNASMDWLRTQGHLPGVESVEEATKAILFRMVADQDFSKSLCKTLDNWNEWVRRGAMNVVDFCLINQAKATFAQASLVIVALSALANGPAAALGIMQECATKWEYVELG